MLPRMSKMQKKPVRAEGASKTEGESPPEHIIKAFGYSLAGIGSAAKHELAFRIELAAFIILLPVLFLLPVGLLFKGILLGSMLAVLVVELLNSALEWVVDYISLDPHPYAKRAKDMGSAAVMLTLVNSGVLWTFALMEWRGF